MKEAAEGEWERRWDARQAELTRLLGPTTGKVFHSLMPLELGGGADVLEFPDYVAGATYVTADLTGSSQPPSLIGQYELMMCTRKETDWAPNLLSGLGGCTLEEVLEPNDTMDIAGGVPEGSTVTALLFLHSGPVHEFVLDGVKAGILLCVGITTPELEQCMAGNTMAVTQALSRAAVLPYTDLARPSVAL